MSIIERLNGFSVECDTCGHGGFLANSDVNKVLLFFNLMKNGWNEEGEDTHKCAFMCHCRI